MRTRTVWAQSVCVGPHLAYLAWPVIGEKRTEVSVWGKKATGEDSALLAGSVNFCGPHVSKEDGA